MSLRARVILPSCDACEDGDLASVSRIENVFFFWGNAYVSSSLPLAWERESESVSLTASSSYSVPVNETESGSATTADARCRLYPEVGFLLW
jgi:hypothetical protein